jgi:hypothetical protein
LLTEEGNLMSAINATAPIVFGALQTGYYFRYHVDEIKHISAHERLSDGAKLVWINLAGYAKINPDLSYFGTQAQIATLVGKELNTVQKLLRMLEDEGLMMSTVDPVSQIKTYYVQLDADGLNKLKTAPRRGESAVMRAVDNSIVPRKNIHTPPGKISGGPPEKNPPLINININKTNNNKHLDYLNADISTAGEATEGMTDADALVFEFQKTQKEIQLQAPDIRQLNAAPLAHAAPEPQESVTSQKGGELDAAESVEALLLSLANKAEEIRAQNPTIGPLKANKQARKAFSEIELASMDEHVQTTNPKSPEAIKTEKPIQSAPEEQKPTEARTIENPVQVTAVPKKPSTENLVTLSIAGRCYLLEDSVKTMALSQLQQMHERGRIKGEAANKPLEALLGEVFYYIAKAGSSQKEATSQGSKLNTALHLLLKGNWQTPNGMVKQTIIAREQAWQRQKKAQGQYAPVSTWSTPYA